MQTLVANGEYEPREQREIKTERHETELKFRLTNPDILGDIIHGLEPLRIHQLYLSHPDEPHSLRLRHTLDQQGQSVYEACIKSRGNLTENGVSRLESTVAISAETFQIYEAMQPAQLYKERYEPLPGVSVDCIAGIDQPLLEIEDIFANQDAFEFHSAFKDVLRDVTDSPDGDNEALAYLLSPDTGERPQQRDTEAVFQEMVTRYAFRPKGSPLVCTISGRSGSGKTTITRELVRRFAEEMPELRVATLSTDDYHRGKKRLEEMLGGPCQNWDAGFVYDTNLIAFDIWELSQQQAIERRSFSFRSQEVEIEGSVEPADIILVEGIVAQSAELDSVRHAHFDMGTPLATCLGRDMERIRQDSRGNGGIGDQLDRLRYIIETAEPTYRVQDRSIRNAFSASTRP